MSHLTQAQLQQLQQSLNERERVAQEELRAHNSQRAAQPYVELAGAVPDPGDASVADLIVDVDNAVTGVRIEELRDIWVARERMRQGSYGVCIDCEEDIDIRRLAVNPAAKRCARCQEVHERTFATAPHPSL